MAMTMTISNNSSAKRITVQIPTSSRDAIEARVIVSVRPSSVVSVEFALRHCDVLKMVFDPTVERGDGLAQRSAKRSQRIFDPRRYLGISATRHEAVALEPPQKQHSSGRP
jgi:hypothetical protein